jgi:hypothetical protein
VARLFGRYPEALARTLEIADRCRFSLDELAYQYPEERTMPGLTPQQALETLTWERATEHYPEGLPDKVIGLLKHELALIETLQYAPYFLTVNAIVRFARSQDILFQGCTAKKPSCGHHRPMPRHWDWRLCRRRGLLGRGACACPVLWEADQGLPVNEHSRHNSIADRGIATVARLVGDLPRLGFDLIGVCSRSRVHR